MPRRGSTKGVFFVGQTVRVREFVQDVRVRRRLKVAIRIDRTPGHGMQVHVVDGLWEDRVRQVFAG